VSLPSRFSGSQIVSELIQCYFRLTSSVDAILCQDGATDDFSSWRKSRGSVRGNIDNIFHSSFAFFVCFRVPGSIYLNLHYD